MIYPDNFEQKIGFDKIRQLIENHCLSPLGEEKVAEMTFSSDFDLIQKQLYQTHEFTRILQEEDSFPSDNFFDVRDSLKKIRIEGTYLIEKELFDMRRSLETIHEILRFFNSCHYGPDPQSPVISKGIPHQVRDDKKYPFLQELASGVASFPQLTKQIDIILDKYGRVRDNASPALADIRRLLTQTANGISKTLHSILRLAQSENLVDKDVTPTVRDGRLMIPISPAFKRRIKGIVHDESATGKTVFIEPAEVVEANNKIRELEGEEKREIIRILTAFTNQIRPEIPEIILSYRFLAEIDFIRSKALFALDIEALLPIFEDKRQMDWIRAVHPLLYLSHKKQNKTVVPLDIELTPRKSIFARHCEGEAQSNPPPTPLKGELPSLFRGGAGGEVLDCFVPLAMTGGVILLVSGPNAGGKSVLLKTVGLLQYMLQSGLLIPVDERSKTGVFKDIFLDIGDEQSIENDLSTYSSHLLNMKFMLKNASSESLILIDEFGSGTEPSIGGAIAEALLHRFNEKACFGVITTHYHNLKLYADDHEGVINGAMLYDRHLMQPLFQLSIGQPGSSFAIEIARKIGLSEEVIAEASEKVGQDYINMDKYLQDIIRDKRYWESKRQQIRQQEKSLEELEAHYQSDIEKLEVQKKEWLAKAKSDAEHLLAEANAKIENTIREIKEAQAEKGKTKIIRKDLEEFKQKVHRTGYTVHDGTDKSTKQKTKDTKTDRAQRTALLEPFFVGESVRMKGQQTIGTVIDTKDDFFVVAFGAIKTAVKAGQLEKVEQEVQGTGLKVEGKRFKVNGKGLRTDSAPSTEYRSPISSFKLEIDVRGMRGAEALQAVTYYIDDAIQCNAGRVRILHGTGTGALRQIIRDYLKTVQGVKRLQDEHVQFGGAGITVVDLE